jgi:hypothetical protein
MAGFGVITEVAARSALSWRCVNSTFSGTRQRLPTVNVSPLRVGDSGGKKQCRIARHTPGGQSGYVAKKDVLPDFAYAIYLSKPASSFAESNGSSEEELHPVAQCSLVREPASALGSSRN